MNSVSSKQLRTYIVWLPALFSDDREDAVEASGEFNDSRNRYFWDSDMKIGDAFGEQLQLEEFAWDVYLMFERGAKWEQTPSPAFWMHQLGDLGDRAPTLDSTMLRTKVEEFLQVGQE